MPIHLEEGRSQRAHGVCIAIWAWRALQLVLQDANETLMDFREIAFLIGQNLKETRSLTLNLTYSCPDLATTQYVCITCKHFEPHKYALIK